MTIKTLFAFAVLATAMSFDCSAMDPKVFRFPECRPTICMSNDNKDIFFVMGTRTYKHNVNQDGACGFNAFIQNNTTAKVFVHPHEQKIIIVSVITNPDLGKDCDEIGIYNINSGKYVGHKREQTSEDLFHHPFRLVCIDEKHVVIGHFEKIPHSQKGTPTITCYDLFSNSLKKLSENKVVIPSPQSETPYFTSLCLTEDKMHCVSGGINGRIKIWNLNTGKCEKTLKEPHRAIIFVGALHNKKIVVQSGEKKSKVTIWNIDTYKREKSFRLDTNKYTKYAIIQIITPNKKYLIATYPTMKHRNKILMLGINGSHIGKIIVECDLPPDIFLSNDGTKMAAVVEPGTAKVWSTPPCLWTKDPFTFMNNIEQFFGEEGKKTSDVRVVTEN